ncbi:MAG: hypothetical protein PGN13_13985 [Patulibacter minatonensis]
MLEVGAARRLDPDPHARHAGRSIADELHPRRRSPQARRRSEGRREPIDEPAHPGGSRDAFGLGPAERELLGFGQRLDEVAQGHRVHARVVDLRRTQPVEVEARELGIPRRAPALGGVDHGHPRRPRVPLGEGREHRQAVRAGADHCEVLHPADHAGAPGS